MHPSIRRQVLIAARVPNRLNVAQASATSCFRSLSQFRQHVARFGHLEHRMAKLLMWEFTLDSPAVTLVELDGPSIRLHGSKARRVMSTAAYFTFGMCQ